MPKKKKVEKVKSAPAPVEKKRHNSVKPKNEKNGKDGKAHAGNAVQEPPAKIKNPKKRAAQEDNDAAPARSEDGQKINRLTMIKTRHEAMKREIDQIREDLESEEEE